MEDVGRDANLVRRGAVYYCRMRCPEHLRRNGIPAEKWVSLDTKEKSVARERMPAARMEVMAFFRGEKPPAIEGVIRPSRPLLQRPSHPDLPMLRRSEVEVLAKEYFSRAWDELEISTADLVTFDREQKERWLQVLQSRLAELENPTEDDPHPTANVEIALLHEVGRRSAYESDPSRLLRSYLLRAMRQLLAVEIERTRGNFADAINDSMFMRDAVQPVARSAREVTKRSTVTLGDCVDRFQTEILDFRSVTPKTGVKHTALLTAVALFFGRETPICDIERADCTRFRDTLGKLPPNFTKIGGGRALDQIAAENVEPVLAWETQNNYLKMAEDLFGWALKERLVADNPAADLAPLRRREAAEEQRLPFRPEELAKIFAAPVYTGCVDDERGFARPGPNVVKRSRYWLPLIALFTGMRMGEILQLTSNHVRRSPLGTPFIVLTRDMVLKTASAEREIPIHPTLLHLGLLEWIEGRPDAAAILFDDVPESKHGYRSDIFTKRFATFLRSINLREERRAKLCFHSFRHTFKDALNEAGAPEAEAEEICGWARGKRTSRRYGTGLSADRLKPFINQIAFEIDLEHLANTSARGRRR